MARIVSITRFPIKGLGPETLDHVDLTAGQALPLDRAYAIENGPGPFDADHPGHVKKKHFLMLAANPALARLACRHDMSSNTVSVGLDTAETVSVTLDNPDTHAPLFAVLERLLDAQVRGTMRIVHAPGQAMTDIRAPHISLINAASVRDLSEKTGQAIDPARFRGNVLIDGLAPWQEFDWVGQAVQLGLVRLQAQNRIGRCAATSVDLATGAHDIDLPRALFDHYGHTQCGLYLSVERGGRIATGDTVSLDPHAAGA